MSSSTRRRSSRPSPTNLTRPSLKCPVTENKNCSLLQLSLTSYLPCFFVYFLYNSCPHNAGCYFYLDRHKLQKATDQTLSGIIGHLYIFKLYRISANHTNVQLSPKKQYVNFLHFLSSAIEINRWWRLKTLLVSPSPRLQSVVSALVFAYLFIIICTDPMYVTLYDC